MPELVWSLHPARPASADAGRAGPVCGPPVLYLHGLAVTASQCWTRTGWLRRVAHRDAVLVQLPGHPDPSHPEREAAACGRLRLPEGAEPEELLTALAAAGEQACSDLGREPLLDAVGYSLGARLGWELARGRPELLRRLVLAGLPVRDLLAEADAAALPESEDPDPARAELGEVLAAATVSATGVAQMVHLLGSRPFRPEPGPTQPLLLAAGTADAIAGADLPRLASLAPHAQTLPLPGRTHVSALTSGLLRRRAVEHLDA